MHKMQIIQQQFSVAFVCLIFHTILSNTNAAKITKLWTEMFHHESKKHLFWGQNIKSQGHKVQKTVLARGFHSCEC